MPQTPKERPEEKLTIAALKGSRRYLEWFNRLRDQTRLPAGLILDAALVAYAKSIGFEQPPPR